MEPRRAIHGLPAEFPVVPTTVTVVGILEVEVAVSASNDERMIIRSDDARWRRSDPGGSRTRDLRIKSPLLYQLSYRVDEGTLAR